MILKISDYIQKHERLLIVLFVLSAGMLMFNKGVNYFAARDTARVTELSQTVAKDQQNASAAAAEAAQAQTAYQTALSAAQASNARLEDAMVQNQALLRANQTKDASLPLPDLAIRWEQLAPVQPGAMVATASGLQITPDAARATVVQLEKVPVLTEQLAQETTIATNDDNVIKQAQTANADLNKQVVALTTENADQKKESAVELVAAKAQCRKSKFMWFKIGVVVGFVAREALGAGLK